MIPPADKILHVLAGQGAFLVGALAGLPFGCPVTLGLLATVMAGIGKEVWDHYHPPHRVEAWDAVATVLGGVSACVLFVLGGAA